MLAVQCQLGPAFTLELNGAILGCAGIMVAWPGVGMVWMIVSDEIDQWGLTMTRYVRQVIKDTVRNFNLHRLEASALCDATKYGRWLELLGFSRERDGIAHQYLPDRRSVCRYEWIREAPCKP